MILSSPQAIDGQHRKAAGMPKYLYWRGNSLWGRYPLPDRPEFYPLGIYTTGSPSDRKRCERQGEEMLAALRTKAKEGRLFDIFDTHTEEPYNPKFWRIAGRYWVGKLQFNKSGSNERYHLLASVRRFGDRYAKDITTEDIRRWLREQKSAGVAVNTINNQLTYLKAAYRYANESEEGRRRLGHNPAVNVEKLPGGNVRRFVLTKEKFERNYEYLRSRNPRFALFYLALWESGRRPLEVSQYTWEMLQSMPIDGVETWYLAIPPEIAKTAEYDVVLLSPRLLSEINRLGYRHGWIFRNANGDRWSNWEHHQAKLVKAFGDDAGVIRDCRRGFVTHKTEVEGHDPFRVRQATGHKTNAVFERYRIGKLRNLRALVGGDPQTQHTIGIQSLTGE